MSEATTGKEQKISGKTDPVTDENLSEINSILLIVGIFLAVLMGAMDSLVVATVLPNIAVDLHQVNGVTFVSGAYLISSTLAIPIFARLSDISSRRNVFLIGLAIFIGGSALAGISQNLSELIAFRALQGIGGGGAIPVALAMVAVLFPPKTRARAIGVLTGASGLSIVLGPLVGSYIVSVTTWRWVFYINLPFGIFAMIVLLLTLGPLRPPVAGKFDVPGAGLLSGWVSLLMVALVEVSDAGLSWTDPIIITLLAGSIALFAVFLWWELRSSQPLVPLRLLRQRIIGANGGIMVFTGVVFSSIISFISIFIGIVLLHGSPSATGDVRDIIYFLTVPMILGAGLSGQLLTRVSYRSVMAPGLALASVAAFFLAKLTTASSSLWVLAWNFLPVGGIALPLIPMGFGLGLALAGPTIAVQNEAPQKEVGAAIGIIRFLQSLGGALGISLLTAFEIWRSQALSQGATTLAASTSALVSTYQEIFLILAVCVVIAFVFSLFLKGRIGQKSKEEEKEEVRSETSSSSLHKQ